MKAVDLKTLLEKKFPAVPFKLVRESVLIQNPEDLPAVVQFLKDSPDIKLDFLSSITAADYLSYLETVYHFYSVELKTGPVMLRARTSRETPQIPSLTPLFLSADLQEREAYDMFGIVFTGHPDLRRLFMWDNFQGWPLRKDYEQEDSDVLETEDINWLDQNGIPVPPALREKAKALQASGKRAVALKPNQAEPA